MMMMVMVVMTSIRSIIYVQLIILFFFLLLSLSLSFFFTFFHSFSFSPHSFSLGDHDLCAELLPDAGHPFLTTLLFHSLNRKSESGLEKNSVSGQCLDQKVTNSGSAPSFHCTLPLHPTHFCPHNKPDTDEGMETRGRGVEVRGDGVKATREMGRHRGWGDRGAWR